MIVKLALFGVNLSLLIGLPKSSFEGAGEAFGGVGLGDFIVAMNEATATIRQ